MVILYGCAGGAGELIRQPANGKVRTPFCIETERSVVMHGTSFNCDCHVCACVFIHSYHLSLIATHNRLLNESKRIVSFRLLISCSLLRIDNGLIQQAARRRSCN